MAGDRKNLQLHRAGPIRSFVVLSVLLLGLLAAPEARAAQRPSFVVVQTDDMVLRMMTGKYSNKRGQKVPIMPRLTSLFGNQGRDFRNAYAPTPMCAPSRASLLSGQLPHNTGVVANDGPFGGWQGWLGSSRMEPNLATVLDDAGYHTAHFGKWINNYGEDPIVAPPVVPPGWDVWASDANNQSTRDYYGYYQLVRNERDGISGEIRGPFGSQTYGDDREIDPAWCDAFSQSPTCNYHADRMSALAATEIREAEEPFFVMLDHHGPHGDNSSPPGPQPATRHIGLADNEVAPRTPNYDERNTTDKDFLLQRVNGRLNQNSIRTIDTIWRRSIESLQAIDEGVALIHRVLRESNRLSNTYFIFTSDNGFFHGEHRVTWGKGLPFEEAAKVPLLIAGPGIGAGTTSTPVSLVDIAPTVLDLADLEAGGMEFDGRSLGPSLEGGASPARAVVIERIAAEEVAGDPDYPPEIPVTPIDPARPPRQAPGLAYRGIRIGHYKYFEIDSGGEELYDLSKDPFELYDQANSPGYREVLAFMRARASNYRDCQGAGCLVPPGNPPEPGELLTDAKPPPEVIGMGKAFHFGEKIYATVSCPIRSSQACLIAAEARRFGVRLSGKVEVRLARGVRARVALPILPGRALEVLRLSERGGRSLIIRTAIEGEGMPSERTVEFRQR
jgi:arylsulfatase A-like enzyme